MGVCYIGWCEICSFRKRHKSWFICKPLVREWAIERYFEFLSWSFLQHIILVCVLIKPHLLSIGNRRWEARHVINKINIINSDFFIFYIAVSLIPSWLHCNSINCIVKFYNIFWCKLSFICKILVACVIATPWRCPSFPVNILILLAFQVSLSMLSNLHVIRFVHRINFILVCFFLDCLDESTMLLDCYISRWYHTMKLIFQILFVIFIRVWRHLWTMPFYLALCLWVPTPWSPFKPWIVNCGLFYNCLLLLIYFVSCPCLLWNIFLLPYLEPIN